MIHLGKPLEEPLVQLLPRHRQLLEGSGRLQENLQQLPEAVGPLMQDHG